ncbi:putative integrase (plasmid) [Cupriavidus metallidurans CH34]|uniref:Integrase n=3 Tax=Burkholderiaceae TaxID=119060 RepID=Q1L9R3_CUPMC|nr:putative integrase [Cupriavidus metallidurans CH34]
MPVSAIATEDGGRHVISRYGDSKWDFYPFIPQLNLKGSSKRINWAIRLSDGSLLTDPQHGQLLASSKAYIWSLFADPVDGRKRPSLLTLCEKTASLVPLLRWMFEMGLRRFEDLSGHTLQYVPAARLNLNGSAAVPHTVATKLFIVEDLYLQRDKLDDALRSHPWPHESAMSLAGERRRHAHRVPKTEFIPDQIAQRITDAALDYVRVKGDSILKARDAVAEARLHSVGRSGGTLTRYLASAATQNGFDGVNHVISEMGMLRTACYVTVAMFSGLRDSEMMSLEENCLSSSRSKDGSIEVLWLHGTIYKTGRRAKKWMVPAVVGDAISVLTRLTEPWRIALAGEERALMGQLDASLGSGSSVRRRLDEVRVQKKSLFLGRQRSGGIGTLSSRAINMNLKEFCEACNIVGLDGNPYPLTTHQFRRSYARFIAKAELGDLLTLQHHFGHWSLDMTALYADGAPDEYETDTELLEMVTEEKRIRQTEVMTSYLDSDAPLANGSHWLEDWRSTVRTAANKEELIAEYAGTITLNGTGHSWCVGNAKGVGCGGLCVFEAQMCVDCNHGIIGQEHRSVWEGIRDQQIEAIAIGDLGESGKARAQQILVKAEKVLRRLDKDPA